MDRKTPTKDFTPFLTGMLRRQKMAATATAVGEPENFSPEVIAHLVEDILRYSQQQSEDDLRTLLRDKGATDSQITLGLQYLKDRGQINIDDGNDPNDAGLYRRA